MIFNLDTIFFYSKVGSKPKEKYLKNCEIEEFVPSQYIKNSQKFSGNQKISWEQTGDELSGKFQGILVVIITQISKMASDLL